MLRDLTWADGGFGSGVLLLTRAAACGALVALVLRIVRAAPPPAGWCPV